MIWSMLSFGIIMILVLGMIIASRLTDKSLQLRGAEPRENCRRGAIRPVWKKNHVPGATLIPKGPR